jgi:hypothetical protein
LYFISADWGVERMPKSPEDLSGLIEQIAREEAKSLGRDISASALRRIARIPKPYKYEKEIGVDVERLQIMIRDIISIASSIVSRDIDLKDMEAALGRVKCHYLWFC